MPAYNFQKRFAPAVESGEKKQTIRALRKDHREPKVGETFVAYTGMRTKACRKLCEGFITEVHTVSLGPLGVFVDNVELSADEREALAKADGFGDWAAMLAWFTYTHSYRFKGRLIRWASMPPTDIRRPIIQEKQ